MMIKCEQHDFYEAIQVSPDLKELIQNLTKIEEYVVIHYEYNGEIADSFFLSTKYAKRYELENESVTPLPDNYPEWVKTLVVVCKKCFENCTRNSWQE